MHWIYVYLAFLNRYGDPGESTEVGLMRGDDEIVSDSIDLWNIAIMFFYGIFSISDDWL